MVIPAQVRRETSSSFPAENPLGAGPQCHLQGGEDTLQGMDGWRMAPVTSGKAVPEEKRPLDGNQCQQKQKAQFCSCLIFSCMSGEPGGIQLAL